MKILPALRFVVLQLFICLLLVASSSRALANDFEAVTLTGLKVNCPSSIRSGVPAEASVFSCTQTASYSDGSSRLVRQSATWSSADASVLSVKELRSFVLLSGGFVDTGLLGSAVVVADTPVVISGSYSEDGVSVSASATVTVKAQKLTALAVNCPASLYVSTTAACTATASYSDGSNKSVSADWLSSKPAILALSAGCNGDSQCMTLTPASVSSNTLVSLSVSYTENGVSKTTTVSVTVKPAPILTRLLVSCPSSVVASSGSSNIGSCILTEFYNGVSTNASQSAVWSSSLPALLSVANPQGQAGGGKLSSFATTVDTPVTITATVNWYGESKTASTSVLVKGTVAVLNSLAISCPASADAGSSVLCLATAGYKDGSSKVVTATWASNSAAAKMNGSVLQAGAVSTDTAATITAVYSERGVNLSALTKVSIKPASANACRQSLPSQGSIAAASGGSYSLAVSSDNCAWIANALSPWLHLPEVSGNGSGELAFTVDANPGSLTRIGNISVGGQLYAVTQLGANSVPISAGAADCVFSWAEKTYPEQFFPPPAATETIGNDYYRYYAGSNAFLGAASFQLLKYVGPLSSGNVLELGDLAYWMATAGCQ